MLNISPDSIQGQIDTSEFEAFTACRTEDTSKTVRRVLLGSLVTFILIMFLPWTQNIRSTGYVTTLLPEQRPQTIQTVIDGRIERWYVKEGDFVERGDTIAFVSETKDDYLNPEFVARTADQVQSKGESVGFYKDKAGALAEQIEVLREGKDLKIEQGQNKIQQLRYKITADSMDLEAERTQLEIALAQFARQKTLYDEGLKSLTDLESRQLKLRETEAKMTSLENKLATTRNELMNAMVNIRSIAAEYDDKIAKSQSERYSTLSSAFDSEAQVSKLKNDLGTYEARTGLYYITAPQNGYVTKALQVGIGENIKAGTGLVSIMPENYELAVEMYVKPLDLPLINKYQPVQIQFDGWPAIVFSGWPNVSYGTYNGKVFAVDNFISDNGLYRILVRADNDAYPWPDALRVGAGSNTITLLKDVPIWYELWRQFNGFPPDYYKPDFKDQNKDKGSAIKLPLKK